MLGSAEFEPKPNQNQREGDVPSAGNTRESWDSGEPVGATAWDEHGKIPCIPGFPSAVWKKGNQTRVGTSFSVILNLPTGPGHCQTQARAWWGSAVGSWELATSLPWGSTGLRLGCLA